MNDEEESCANNFQHELDLTSLTIPFRDLPPKIEDGCLVFTLDGLCKHCNRSCGMAVSVPLEDVQW